MQVESAAFLGPLSTVGEIQLKKKKKIPQPRKPPHKGSRRRKKIYCGISVKPEGDARYNELTDCKNTDRNLLHVQPSRYNPLYARSRDKQPPVLKREDLTGRFVTNSGS